MNKEDLKILFSGMDVEQGFDLALDLISCLSSEAEDDLKILEWAKSHLNNVSDTQISMDFQTRMKQLEANLDELDSFHDTEEWYEYCHYSGYPSYYENYGLNGNEVECLLNQCSEQIKELKKQNFESVPWEERKKEIGVLLQKAGNFYDEDYGDLESDLRFLAEDFVIREEEALDIAGSLIQEQEDFVVDVLFDMDLCEELLQLTKTHPNLQEDKNMMSYLLKQTGRTEEWLAMLWDLIEKQAYGDFMAVGQLIDYYIENRQPEMIEKVCQTVLDKLAGSDKYNCQIYAALCTGMIKAARSQDPVELSKVKKWTLEHFLCADSDPEKEMQELEEIFTQDDFRQNEAAISKKLQKNPTLNIRFLIGLGRMDQALDLYRSHRPYRLNGNMSSSGISDPDWKITHQLAKKYPDQIIPIFQDCIEIQILKRNNSGYRNAIDLLNVLREIYRDGGRYDQWNQYCEGVEDRHYRKYNFMNDFQRIRRI